MRAHRRPAAAGGAVYVWIVVLLSLAPLAPAWSGELHTAVERGEIERVRQLLAGGADVDAASPYGATPLVTAILAEQRPVVELLLAKGADTNRTSRISQDLFEGGSGDTEGSRKIDVTPLLVAVFKKDMELARVLLAAGANVNFAGGDGFTPLLVAAARGQEAIAQLLLDHGAAVDTANDQGETPLLLALQEENVPLTEVLLRKGAAVNVADKRGMTPLRVAIELPNTQLAELLRERGAIVELPDKDGTPPLVAPIDVMGVRPERGNYDLGPDAWPDLRGIALDRANGKIYWSEFGRGRIRRANLSGSEVEDVVAVDGPVGVAVDPATGRLYWTTDATYPRAVQRRRLARGGNETLLEGRYVNRPGPIILETKSGQVYWAESVAGRIRRARLDGSKVQDLLISGLGVTDRSGSEVAGVAGLAIDAEAGKIYWTELTTGTILRANLDGSQEEEVLTARAGLEFPIGIAIDAGRRKLYWSDRSRAKIQRANLDGSGIQDLVTADHGLVDPRAIALDAEGAKLYWVDAATAKIQRANLDGTMVEDVVRAGAAQTVPVTGERSACERAMATATRRLVSRVLTALATCLDKVGALKAVKSTEDAATDAVGTCVTQLRVLYDSRRHAERLEDEWHAAVRGVCTEIPPGAAEAIEAGRRRAYRLFAAAYPRAGEWLEEIRPFIAAQPAPTQDPALVADTLRALDKASAAMQPDPPKPGTPQLPASGQLTSYKAMSRQADGRMVAVGDDGAVRAGGSPQYRGNPDGTITDLTTGLTWEKKCDCPDQLHDYRTALRWSGNDVETTIWDWLDAVNREGGTGFAGHNDWRIPNVKELQTLIDYERFNPATSAVFDAAACGLGCTNLADANCSCTAMDSYWSSTTYADSPQRAWVVGFNLGLIGDMSKNEDLPVRAVRGGR